MGIGTGKGITIAFATSGFDLIVRKLTMPEMSRGDKIAVTGLNPSGLTHDYIMPIMVEIGDASIEGVFDPDSVKPTTAMETASEEITITMPSGATYVGLAAMKKFTPGEMNLEGEMTYTSEVAILQKLVFTPAV